MNQLTPMSYEEWLAKSNLIRRIHFADKDRSKLHVELDEFLTFFTDDISGCELEDLFNMVKELCSKAQDVISLMYTIQEKMTISKTS